MARTRYDESFPQRAYQLAREGFTDAQIAVRLGVSASTFYSYRQKYRDFLEALAEGRNELDLNVENRLMDLVLGRCVVTTTVTDDLGRTKTTTRTVPPNLKAIIYWLEKRVYVRDQPPAEITKRKNEEETRRYIREMMTFAENGCRDVAVKLTVDDGDDIEEREFVLENTTHLNQDDEPEREDAVEHNDTPDTPDTPRGESERDNAVEHNDTPNSPECDGDEPDEWLDGRLPGPRKPVRRTTQFNLVPKPWRMDERKG